MPCFSYFWTCIILLCFFWHQRSRRHCLSNYVLLFINTFNVLSVYLVLQGFLRFSTEFMPILTSIDRFSGKFQNFIFSSSPYFHLNLCFIVNIEDNVQSLVWGRGWQILNQNLYVVAVGAHVWLVQWIELLRILNMPLLLRDLVLTVLD